MKIRPDKGFLGPLKSIKSDKDLMRTVSSKHPGDFTNFTIIRGDEKLRISVTLGERPSDGNVISKTSKESESDILGIRVSSTKDNNGVKIISIDKGSPAQKNGLAVNDVILKIARNKINSVEDYDNIIKRYDDGDVIMIRIERNGNQVIRAFNIN